MTRNYYKEAEDVLAEGGFYTFSDILEYLQYGGMQSFATLDSIIVTRINVYPRRTVLEIVLAVGKYDEIVDLEKEVIGFAQQHDCSAIVACGRDGWYSKRTEGWERTASVYTKVI